MSVDFIKERIGSSSIALAKKQQDQLAYFTKSTIQQDITIDYLEQWANRNYRSSEDFLNWVLTIFKTENFLSFYKYMRRPLPSAELVSKRIKSPLSRVFFSEDAFFHYTVRGESAEPPESLEIKEFNEDIFDALFFRHNDIMIHDLKDVNKPFREIISIDRVVSLESHKNVIHRLAYTAQATIVDELGNEKIIKGFIYMDSEAYAFYDSDHKLLKLEPHDLGQCPADYIASKAFDNDDIVRKSMFSESRGMLEEFVFLKVLQKMADAAGVLPISVRVKTSDSEGDDIEGQKDGEPMSSKQIGGQRSEEIGSAFNQSKSILQPGTEVKVKPRKKQDNSLDMDMINNFVKFYHMPKEQLEFVNERVKEIQSIIITSLVGDFSEANPEAMNELQVSKGFVSKEDRIRELAKEMSRIRERSDYKLLALEFGPDNVTNEANYGTDFFTETQEQIYKLFKEAPNPIERQNQLIRLAKNKNKFNPRKGKKEVILNLLLPYPADIDFDKALARGIVDDTTFKYQTQFSHWVGLFQVRHGDILSFWEMLGGTDEENLIAINNLILIIINESATEGT